jgi:hypothetical protein
MFVLTVRNGMEIAVPETRDIREIFG